MSDDLGPKVSEHHGGMAVYVMGSLFCLAVAIGTGWAAGHARKNTQLFGLTSLLLAGGTIVLASAGWKARLYRVYVWRDGVTWSFGNDKGRVRFSEIRSVETVAMRRSPAALAVDTLRGPMLVPLTVTSRDELIGHVVERAPKPVNKNSDRS